MTENHVAYPQLLALTLRGSITEYSVANLLTWGLRSDDASPSIILSPAKSFLVGREKNPITLPILQPRHAQSLPLLDGVRR